MLHAQLLNYPVRQLGVSDGLPQGSVNIIFQSSEGFIWMGTGDGLARYDGLHFHTFRGPYNDTTGLRLSARMVSGRMAEDRLGGIWFTSNTGLSCYQTRSRHFRHVSVPASSPEDISILGITSQNNLVIGDGKQVWMLGLSGGNTAMRSLGNIPTGAGKLAVLAGNTLYYAIGDDLYSKDLPFGKEVRLHHCSGLIKIFPDGNARLIAWSRDSIYSIEESHLQKAVQLPATLKKLEFLPFLKHTEDTWYGMSKAGFTRLDIREGSYQYIPVGGIPARSLNTTMVLCMMMDKTGNVWVGTEGSGINILDTKGFRFHTSMLLPRPSGSQPQMMVKSMLEVGGKLWIGSFDSGLYILDRKTGLLQNHFPFSDKKGRISLLYRDSTGRIWMNVEERIGIVDSQTYRFQQWKRIPDDVPGNLAAFSICEYRRNHFLLGSIYGLHLMWLENGKAHIRKFASRFEATQGQITALSKAADGSIFMGKVRDGFYRIRIFPEQDSIQILDDGFHLTGIRDIQFFRVGKYAAMATENGFLFYEIHARKHQFIDEKDGLSNSHIYGILRSGDSVLWVSTNRGINELKISWTSSGPNLKKLFSFTAADGLQSNEFNTGAYCYCADGALAFGGVKGINWFYPAQLHKNPFPPNAILTGIMVNEHPYQSDTDVSYLHSISLPYDSNTLAFSFAALDFTNPAANYFQYKLEGFDADWVIAREGHDARYANLPPGKYHFLLRAANNDGIWNESPLQLSLTIRPPWWMQWWAKSLAALLLMMLLFLIMRQYLRRKLTKERRLQERRQAIDEERLRISRDMHDDLGTGLTKIALLSEVARRKNVSQQPASLKEIADTSRELTQRIGEIVWTLNPHNDKLDTLIAYLREYLQEHFEFINVPEFISDFPDEVPSIPLSHGVRQVVLLVIKEAVNNALKYADASTIHVGMSFHVSDLVFCVEDDGKGFDAHEPDNNRQLGGNGLGNMKARLENIGGRFELVTHPGKGTIVRFSVPRPVS